MLPLLLEGSVKNIYGVKGESPYVFDFSNRYSVFDWGVMPNELENKGKALSYMANLFFELLGNSEKWKSWTPSIELDESLKRNLESLKEKGLPHHCLGLEVSDEITSKLKVTPVNVIYPDFENGNWDYADYKSNPVNTLVPLEFIFRFGMPKGSSLSKRINNEEYLNELGLSNVPTFGDEFEIPVIEFSTKLEPSDRYISYKEAREIANLNEVEFENILSLLKLTAMRLKDIYKEVDIKLWDGKFEFAFGNTDSNGNREFMIVDSIGPDELRLTRENVSLSKENLRSFYRDTPWHMAVEEAKAMAEKRGEKNWKDICVKELGKSPAKLEDEYLKYAEGIYTSLSNELSQKFEKRKVFSDAIELKEVINFFRGRM